MTTIINASPSNGLVSTADGSGVLKVQSNGVTTNALAWVNFTGSTAVRNASYNVSSVTRNSTGNYTISFATAMTDANYTACAAGEVSSLGSLLYRAGTFSTSAITNMIFTNSSMAAADPTVASVIVFGN